MKIVISGSGYVNVESGICGANVGKNLMLCY